MSKKIRWSLDLRWQKAGDSIGYYGLKDGVRMRSSADPDFKIDWETFDAVDRHDPNAKVHHLMAVKLVHSLTHISYVFLTTRKVARCIISRASLVLR